MVSMVVSVAGPTGLPIHPMGMSQKWETEERVGGGSKEWTEVIATYVVELCGSLTDEKGVTNASGKRWSGK